jgi:prepilin signal peptidase PulO-like enzyme (type II secretory pathway)
MIFILVTIFFIFGLIIGSFLNVVIIRLNTERSFGGRSACMSCQNKLTWYELMPVLSFLGLRGRCRNCKTKISIQYPLVELATGLIFAALFLKLQNIFFISTFLFTIAYVYYTIVFSLLIVIATYDLKHKIIPDILSFVLGVFAFIGLFFFSGNSSPIFYWHIPLVLEFLSGPLIALPFALFWFLSSGKWMGLGDAKLALGVGWLLGIGSALSGLVIAFWSGAVIGILLIIFSKKYGMKSEIPFAPYLVLGTFLAFIFGLNLFGI